MKKNLPLIIIFILTFIFPLVTGLIAFNINPPQDLSLLPEDNPDKVQITCLDTQTNKVITLDLEEYLVEVLAAEMPAEYHPEALKAQAVAARSYILSRTQSPNPQHPQADVCTDPKHCNDRATEAVAKAKWSPHQRAQNWEKLKSAVEATQGEYMTYDNQVIQACFFASNGGRTENSEDVWGGSLPYLKSVESYGDAVSPDRESTLTVSVEQFAKGLNVSLPLQIGTPSRTQGGSVSAIEICGKSFKGTEIRQIFGLKSANFTITEDGQNITFTVLGYGHGVGMSQVGANYMAQSGKKYTEILSHYYTNIQIAKM